MLAGWEASLDTLQMLFADLLARLVGQTGVAAHTAATQLDQLANLGCIRQPAGEDLCEPGLPSLMTHVQVRQPGN